MTPQQTKLGIGAVVLVAILAGGLSLNRSSKDGKAGADGNSAELAEADIRQDKISLGSRAGADGNDLTSIKKMSAGSGNHGKSASDDADLASIIDTATTAVQPIETEAETRERERYEKAQENKFKYREVDPAKIKPAELTPALQQATKEYGLPDNVLAAMMYVETGGTHRDGEHSMEAGYGVMNLRENNMVDTLGEASSLIGKSKEDVLYNQADNVKAAAALLKSYYNDALASGLSESEALYAAVSQMSGRSDPELASALADQTAAMMMKGFELHLSDGGGDVIVPPNPNPPFLPKNYELVGMQPPSNGHGAEVLPGTTPPDATAYGGGGGSAAGGAQVTP